MENLLLFQQKMVKEMGDYQTVRCKDIRNALSLGYRIDVYQESINKVFSEYLVNYDYLISTIENYGFVLLERDEIEDIDYPILGNFEQLYYQMNSELNKKIRRSDIVLHPDEPLRKEISYLNNYFIFKKVREVNVKTVSKSLINESPQHGDETKQTVEAVTDVPKVKKKKKIKIQAPKEEEPHQFLKMNPKFRKR